MMLKNTSKKSTDNKNFGKSTRYFILFYIIIVLVMVAAFCTNTLYNMQKNTHFILDSNIDLIGTRISETVNLAQSLAQSDFIQDPNTTGGQKSIELKKYSDQFGYMMIRYVDKEINVWNEKNISTSLEKRDYMQKLFATGTMQITDAFPAGVDGATMNYTIAVPILRDGRVDGCVFSSIYFDEVEEILENNSTKQPYIFTLYGGNSRVMNSTDPNVTYDQHYLERAKGLHYLNTDIKTIEASMQNGEAGSHWEIADGKLYYSSHNRIPSTNWELFCKTGFSEAFSSIGSALLLVLLMITILFFLLIYLEKKFLNKRMAVIDMLLKSVQELEQRIYQTEKPENVDFREIIQLTSKGLTDGLTGTVTRTVFFDQVGNHMRSKGPDEQFIMAFVDVDNLKLINDTYGHDIGDMALKSTGYVLREYEKRYNGFIGRYGGDEFIVLLTGFTSKENMNNVLEELVARLHTDSLTSEGMLNVHCSVGAVACTANDCGKIESLIRQADEALYHVKQNGKDGYELV